MKTEQSLTSADLFARENRPRMLLIIAMVITISVLHLQFPHNMEKLHVVARELYFLPIILSAFWFGLRGALVTTLLITSFYFSYTVVHWRGFITDDLERLIEIIFFILVAGITGYLQDRQRALSAEKLAAVKALAGTVAHEINSPLFVAMGTLELLQDDFEPDSEPFQEIERSRKNLKEVKDLVKKISTIEDVVTRDYDGISQIVDLAQSTQRENSDQHR